MGDHMVLCVDHINSPEPFQTVQAAEVPRSSDERSSHLTPNPSTSIDMKDLEEHGRVDEEEPLIQMVECRICQDEDSIQNLEIPCACNGSLKFAHRKCVQRWCDEKGDITCEICHQPYQPGYTAPPPVPCSEDITIDIRGIWTISGGPLDLHDPRLLAMATAERHLLATEYDDHDANANGSAFYRFAALVLMGLLLLRHSLTIGNGDADADASTFLSLIVLRAAGFLLPCYIIIWAIGICQRRRQRQEAEAAAAAAAEFAILVQGVQRRGLEFTLPPGLAPTLGPPMSSHQEPVL